MMKKLISAVLLTVAAVAPAVLAGCEKDEIHIDRQVEIQDQVISQEEVVE